MGYWDQFVRGSFLGPSCHVYGVSLGGRLECFSGGGVCVVALFLRV